MALPQIKENELQFFVFGPGTGELVVVRAPPGKWLIVDGCSVGGIKGEGIDRLHRTARQVLLTALPRAHDLQAKSVSTASRSALARSRGGLLPVPPPPTFPDCFVAVSFRAGKKGVTVQRGTGGHPLTRTTSAPSTRRRSTRARRAPPRAR